MASVLSWETETKPQSLQRSTDLEPYGKLGSKLIRVVSKAEDETEHPGPLRPRTVSQACCCWFDDNSAPHLDGLLKSIVD